MVSVLAVAPGGSVLLLDCGSEAVDVIDVEDPKLVGATGCPFV